MRIAVTGATGFIGSHVVRRLEELNLDFVGSGRDAAKWKSRRPFVALDCSTAGPDSFERLGSPDVLLHLSWNGLPNYRSLHHFELELPRQYAFIKRLVDGGLRHLVVVGTCFEYGMKEGMLTESAQTEPSNPYGFAKDTLRRQLEYLAHASGLELTWARLFYMWGEGQAANSLYSQLTAAVGRKDRAFDMSGGEQLRDYLPVTLIAQHLVHLALKPGAGIVNICSGQPVSVRRLVEDWISLNGWDIALNLGKYPYADYEPMAFWGDCKKLQKWLSE